MRGQKGCKLMYDLEEKKCKKCNRWFTYNKKTEVFWDESGYGYSVLLVRCPYCGCYHVVKIVEDDWLKNI